MRCSKCGAENPDRAKFCVECGSPLARRCPSCNAANPPTAKFCLECAKPLESSVDASDRVSDASMPPQPSGHGSDAALERFARTPGLQHPRESSTTETDSIEGERRHLSVLFCDLVNSTEIVARLDPEEWGHIATDFHNAAAEAVGHLGGHVAEFLGDGVVVYFGYPEAHEDDVERAVRGGLAIVDAIGSLNGRLAASGVKLSVRVGIHTGPVVISHGGGRGTRVFGDTTFIASRVQNSAEPNTVVITKHTHPLVVGRFITQSLGKHRLKGVEEPVELFRIVRSSGTRSRLTIAAARGLTPYVGREDEMRMLESRWELAREGEGQMVLIAGEPGIGKSRALRQFRGMLDPTLHRWLESACDPYFETTPFYPIVDILKQVIGMNAATSDDERLALLEDTLNDAGLEQTKVGSSLADLLNIPSGDRYPQPTDAPEQARRRMLAAITNLLFGAAGSQPTVLVLDDLQWADASTLELLGLIVEQNATAPVLIITTARPEFRVPWPMRAHHLQIKLSRLRNRHARDMVAQVAASAALSKEIVDALVSRASGVPLFIEELTRVVLEEGGLDATRKIPRILQNSLTARLDRTGAAREIAQIASVIGREFSYEMLRAVAPVSDNELRTALERLADAELIYARGIAPDSSYIFKHALIQNAAYESLLKIRRADLHRRVAETISTRFPSAAEEQIEVLAHHRTEGGLVNEAIEDWEEAGRKALRRSAHAEAISHFRRALHLLDSIPESPERSSRELRLLVSLANPLAATRGYLAPELEEVTKRARELCAELGETPRVFNVLGLLNSIYYNRGEPEPALELANQMMRIAETANDPLLLIWAHYAIGYDLVVSGDPVTARTHLERVLSLYDPNRQGSYGFVQDPGVTGLAMLSAVLEDLGYPDDALVRSKEALALARRGKDVYSLALVFNIAVRRYLNRGDELAASAILDEAVPLAMEHGFENLLSSLILEHGKLLVRQGRYAEGIDKLRESLERLRDPGSVEFQHCRLNLAYACGKAGRLVEAFDLLAEAEETQKKSTSPRRHADLLWLKGEILALATDRAAEAEQSFRDFIELARRISAKSWELLGTTSLARLLRDTDRRGEARAMLANIYGWFTQGLDTADLKDAKALLDELSS
jgi:class 3 adenylate cyclase/tetratricopeptide (TPR) repeat protein/ribosomal protein L40E